MSPSTDNVMDVYRRSTFHAFSDGLSWYDDANDYAGILSSTYDVSVPQAAGIIAALSPMNGWENNKNKAMQLIRQGNGDGCGLYNNVAKAMSILRGGYDVNPLDFLGGNKVRAFYATILNPAGDHSPVIDRHAFDIAVGSVTSDKARSILSRKGAYEAFSICYREAAIMAGIGAAQMQAITWMQWRLEKGIG